MVLWFCGSISEKLSKVRTHEVELQTLQADSGGALMVLCKAERPEAGISEGPIGADGRRSG